MSNPQPQHSDRTDQVAAGPGYAVHYCVDYRDRPFQKSCECRHGDEMALPINLRVEKVRGRNVMLSDGVVCLDCGTDRTGQLDLIDGLTEAFFATRDAFPLAMRVHTLVEHCRDDLAGQVLPRWMGAPLGLLPRQLDTYNRTVRAFSALQYLADRASRRTLAKTA